MLLCLITLIFNHSFLSLLILNSDVNSDILVLSVSLSQTLFTPI